LGYPTNTPGIGVDLRHLDQVIAYPARDMSITVQAGITIANLQEILAKEDQQLPVDVPFPEQATLGGAIAVNASGPRRYGYGTLRDYVIGISFINDEGQEVKAGGRVVKNVAGYDLMKLHIGALGTLGIVTQVTLKVRPQAEAESIAQVDCGAASLGDFLDRLKNAPIRSVCVDVLNGAAVRALSIPGPSGLPRSEWMAFIGFESNGTALLKQNVYIAKNFPGLLDIRAGPLTYLWKPLTDVAICSAAKLS